MTAKVVNWCIHTTGGFADLTAPGVVQHCPVIIRGETIDVDVNVVRFFFVVVVSGRCFGASERQR